MKVLITGAGGQVASALVRRAPTGIEVVALERSELDIADERAVQEKLGSLLPQVVINTAAYTAVDKAESEKSRAFEVNAEGPAHLASAARKTRARLIHVSTDFVFDGGKARPYSPADPTRPLSVYGSSKLEGEKRVQEILGDEAVILRTAWVYAVNGRNFVHTMLRLMREREEVRIVEDQIGTPTWAESIATLLWAMVGKPATGGIFHWTDAGIASWFDFGVAIQEEAHALGLIPNKVPVIPINTEEYPTPARRPSYSVLDRRSSETVFGVRASHWRANLRKMLMELKHG